MTEEASEAARRRPRHLPLWARFALTVAAIALWWAVAGEGLHELGPAFARMPAWALGSAIAVGVLMYVPAALRWRLLMASYGGRRLPTLGRLFHLSLIGQFYNTFIPGNVGGDVLRGHWTRRVIPAGGAYLVVLVERLFGLSGLLVLVSVGLLVRPQLAPLRWVGLGGVLLAIALLAVLASARRLGGRLSGRLGRTLARLPPLSRAGPLPMALFLSVLIHAAQALMAAALFAGLDVPVPAVDLLVLVPVALAAMYLPTVAGLGAREAAFVLLFRPLGIGSAAATVVSLGMLSAQLAVAAIGGVLQVVGRPVLRGAS